jgi:diguanylate cyclase (GGDEF)-like protein
LSALVEAQYGLVRTLERNGYLPPFEANRLCTGLQEMQKLRLRGASETVARAAQLSSRLNAALADDRARSARHAQQALELLDAIARLCSTCVEPSELFAAVLATVAQVVPFTSGTLFLYDPIQRRLDPVASRGGYLNLIEGVTFELGSGFSAWVARQRKPVLLTNLHRTTQPAMPAVRSFLCVPLLVQDELVGVVNISDTAPGAFTEDHKRLLTLVGAQAAGVLQRLAALRAADAMGVRDGLTGLYNRRHFLEQLTREVARADRMCAPLSLALLDVDDLRTLNETLGPTGGDQLLTALGQLLSGASRSADLAARLEGGKFAVLLSGTDASHALLAGERLRAAVAAHAFPGRRLTVSVGVATFPTDAKGSEELLAHADLALYVAKQGGRNRVASCPTERVV